MRPVSGCYRGLVGYGGRTWNAGALYIFLPEAAPQGPHLQNGCIMSASLVLHPVLVVTVGVGDDD